MSEIKINLEELFNNHFDCYTNFEDKGNYNDEPAISKDKFKELFLEFGKQLLELAAENAECKLKIKIECNKSQLENGFVFGTNAIIINKQSILDTINQIE